MLVEAIELSFCFAYAETADDIWGPNNINANKLDNIEFFYVFHFSYCNVLLIFLSR